MLNVPCPHCGSFNDETATVCYFCKKELLVSPERAEKVRKAASEPRRAEFRRPGCLTIYALLSFLSGALGIFLALYVPTMVANDPSLLSEASLEAQGIDPAALTFLRQYFTYYFLFLLVASVVTLLIGWGLWTMRNWSRILVLLSQGFSLLTGIFFLFYSIVQTRGNLFICAAYAVSLILPGIIFLWFLLNRRLFR